MRAARMHGEAAAGRAHRGRQAGCRNAGRAPMPRNASPEPADGRLRLEAGLPVTASTGSGCATDPSRLSARPTTPRSRARRAGMHARAATATDERYARTCCASLASAYGRRRTQESATPRPGRSRCEAEEASTSRRPNLLQATRGRCGETVRTCKVRALRAATKRVTAKRAARPQLSRRMARTIPKNRRSAATFRHRR